jgi:poly(A) polymerase
MNRSLEKIAAGESVRLIAGLAAEFGVNVFLTGGCLRDYLMGRPVKDLDFALDGASTEFPRRYAERWGGTFFWLDEERLQARVVKKLAGETLICDFAPLRGTTIEDDLRLRDFTVNALAIPVSGDRTLIDPLQGEADLRRHVIRACSDHAFDDDPLRLLRALRFAAELGFEIEAGTWSALHRKAPLLAAVAAERIRDELFRILAAPGIGTSLGLLAESGLLGEVMPEGLLQTVTNRQVAPAVALERLCSDPDLLVPGEANRLSAYLDGEVESGITVLSLIKFAVVLDPDGEADIPRLAERLRLGRKAARLLEMFCRDEHVVFGMLERTMTERALFRFFRDRDPFGPGMVILALAAGAVATSLASRLLGYYVRDYDPAGDDLLLTGAEVMSLLGIGEGQAVGEALAALWDYESRGLVNDRAEARIFVKNLLTKREPVR